MAETVPSETGVCTLAVSRFDGHIASSRYQRSVQSSWCWHKGRMADFLADTTLYKTTGVPDKGSSPVN
jgi:hypothetical protein